MTRLALFGMVAVLCCLFVTGCGGGSSSPDITWNSVGISSASRQITVNWSATAAATKTTTPTYNLYWSTSPGVTKKTGTKITNVTSPYVHTGLDNDVMYYYVVTTVIGDNESSASTQVATSPKAVLPLVPTGVTVAPLNTSIQIKIDRTGATATTKFNLYWSTSADFKDVTEITNAFGTGTTFQHTGLKNGTMYYYAVTADGPDGESPWSKIVAALPLADSSATNYAISSSPAKIATPNAITAVAASQLVTLTWNIPTNQIPTVFDPLATPTQTPVISAYTIYWSTTLISDLAKANKISFPVTSKTKPPMTFAHNTGLANGTSYYYVITAVADADANGNPLKTANGQNLTFESPLSSQVSVTPETKAPVPPTGFSAASGSQKITLAWTKSTTTNTVYNVYAATRVPVRPEDLVTTANQIGTTSATSYTHSGLQNGVTYYYVITAITTGESTPTPVIAISL